MKGDFTRNSFRESARYTSVQLLAGRPLLDADWNEAMEILGQRSARLARDVIGRVGTHVDSDGFRVDILPDNTTQVFAGSYYLDGLHCVNEADLPIELPPGAPLGDYHVYLEAWPVLVTALEDSQLREPGLLGPDHAARTKVVWRVGLQASGGEPPCAANDPAWAPTARPHSDARLRARSQPPAGGNDPCILPAEAGYRSLENELFRVQVHHLFELGGALTRVTWKWGRDNGSTVLGWANPSITVDGPALARLRGDLSGMRPITSLLEPDDLLELSSDAIEDEDQPGYLVRLVSVSEEELVVAPALDHTTIGAVALDGLDVSGFTKIRRWADVAQHELPNTGPEDRSAGRTSTWQALAGSGGVEVDLGPGRYNVGDYWTIPARTSLGDILWPPPHLVDDPEWAPAEGTRRHYAALATLRNTATGWEWVQDCRRTFASLVDHQGGGGCHEVIVTADSLSSRLSTLGASGVLRLCLSEGDYELGSTVEVSGAARVVIEGAGEATRIVAPSGATALSFTGCEQVVLRDLVVESPDQEPGIVTGGHALVAVDCTELRLERVTVRCGTAGAGARACLHASSADDPTGTEQARTSVSLRDCVLEAGDYQDGLVAHDVYELEVEGCTIAPNSSADAWSLAQRVESDAVFLSSVRPQLLLMVTNAEGSDVPSTDPWLLERSGFGTAQEMWDVLISRNEGLEGETVERYFALADLVLSASEYADLETADGPLLGGWYEHRFSVEDSPRVVRDGIRVEGIEPDRVHIHGNRVVDAERPLVMALTGSPSAPSGERFRVLSSPPAQGQRRSSNDQPRQVVVEHNTFEAWIGAHSTAGGAAVMVGAVQQLGLVGNRLEIRRTALADADVGVARRWPVEAVRIDRPLGPLVVVTGNLAIASDEASGRSDFDVGLLWLESVGAGTSDLGNAAQPIRSSLDGGMRLVDQNLWAGLVAIRVDTSLLP